MKWTLLVLPPFSLCRRGKFALWVLRRFTPLLDILQGLLIPRKESEDGFLKSNQLPLLLLRPKLSTVPLSVLMSVRTKRLPKNLLLRLAHLRAVPDVDL